jgi:hypothetical protein
MGAPALPGDTKLNNCRRSFILCRVKFYVNGARADACAKPFQSHEIRAGKLNRA